MENNDQILSGWDEERRRFGCMDDVVLELPRIAAFLHTKNGRSRLAVSGVRFSRDMREIIRSKDAIRTIIFPRTARAVMQGAFSGN